MLIVSTTGSKSNRLQTYMNPFRFVWGISTIDEMLITQHIAHTKTALMKISNS